MIVIVIVVVLVLCLLFVCCCLFEDAFAQLHLRCYQQRAWRALFFAVTLQQLIPFCAPRRCGMEHAIIIYI